MTKRDIRKEITDQIIALIKEHGENWTKPFADLAGAPRNAKTGRKYTGGNFFWLGLQGQTYWATYKQWNELGAQVLKDSKATHITVPLVIKDKEDSGKVVRVLFKGAAVFSAAQVDGWEEPVIDRPDLTKRLANADAFIEATGADIRYSSQGRAYYNRADDFIHLPNRENFTDTEFSSATEAFYGTELHELTHWTGSPDRLGRKKGVVFGDEDYAYEELVAEIGATIAIAELQIAPSVRPDHSQYIAAWLNALDNDKNFIFKAASEAQKAFEYLESLQPKTQPQEEAA
jgi:antirestriction protein ArdC